MCPPIAQSRFKKNELEKMARMFEHTVVELAEHAHACLQRTLSAAESAVSILDMLPCPLLLLLFQHLSHQQLQK